MKQDHSSKINLEFRGGFTVRATASAVAFLWSNWEVVYLVCPGRMKARRLTETSWEGSGFGGYGNWHLTKSQFNADSGHFEYHSLQSFLGCKFVMRTCNDYNRLDNDKISYFGSAIIPRKNVNIFLRPIIHILMNQVGTYCNHIGALAAERITANPALVADKAGKEAFKIYQQFLDEEATIRRGGSGAFRFMTPSARGATSPTNELETLRKRLENLESKFSALETTLPLKDLHTSLSLFAASPKMALVQNRTIIEHIAKTIFTFEIGKPGKKITNQTLVDQITKNSDNVPAAILAHMATVTDFGNMGAHTEDINSAQRLVSMHDFSVSFSSTLSVTEWFFNEYLPSKKGLIK